MEFNGQAIRDRVARDLRLGDEALGVYDAALKFAQQELATKRETHDIYPLSGFLEEQAKGLAEQGFFTFALAAADGGLGMTLRDLNLALCALAQHEPAFATLVLNQALSADLVAAAGDGAGRKEVLAAIGSGAYCAYPLFHDALDGFESLRFENGRLRGALRNLTLAPLAGYCIVPAREGEGVSLFWAKAQDPAVRRGPALFMHGLRQCPHGDMAFDVKLGAACGRLGSPGGGSDWLVRQRNRFAGAALATISGVALGATACVADYMRQRYQTGTQLIDKSPLRVMLANLRIAAWESLYAADRAAFNADEGRQTDDVQLPTLIDYKDRVADLMPDAVQMMGGYGYMRDFDQEKRYRDARMLQAVFGRSEFLKSDLISATVAV